MYARFAFKEFDLSFCFQLFESDEQYFYSLIYVHDKQSGLTTDSIFIVSEYMHSDFLNCNNMVSYSTNFKADRDIVDNHFGDLVVADFNFDGKDDIAVINDRGGNGGPLYSFFLQQENKKFLLDNFLTDSMIFFPSEINRKNKTLTTYVHVGMCGLSERVFKLNGKTNTWTEKSSRMINVCEE